MAGVVYTVSDLKTQLGQMGIDPRRPLLVHSSMKAIGQVEGGPEAVLDALCQYMREGLLILPTHTWAQMGPSHSVFDVEREPSCVGILTNLFRKRAGVVRSLHPTHSVAATGPGAAEYAAGEENARSPCPRTGCWGKLYDLDAAILFLGCKLTNNTFLHGVEEWCGVPNRLSDTPEEFTVIDSRGRRYSVPQYRHRTVPELNVSEHYGKMRPAFEEGGAIRYGWFGEAVCIVGDAVKMADITARYLRRYPHLFDDDTPLEAFPLTEEEKTAPSGL